MRLSTKGRFAVTAMIDVGLRANAGPVSLADISTRHRISLSYLEQLFSKLRQHGLVPAVATTWPAMPTRSRWRTSSGRSKAPGATVTRTSTRCPKRPARRR